MEVNADIVGKNLEEEEEAEEEMEAEETED